MPVVARAVDGGTSFYDHVFPVAGPHWIRGSTGEFGAPRSGGRTHEGFDVVAACGAPLLAARGGRVLRAGHDPVLYGNFLSIHGEGERRSYFYAHLPRPSPLRRGDRVWTGQRVGAVGDTGNARSVGCHLHFEIHVGGRPIDPAPALRRWARNPRRIGFDTKCMPNVMRCRLRSRYSSSSYSTHSLRSAPVES